MRSFHISSAARYCQTSMRQLQGTFDSIIYVTSLCQEKSHIWDAIDIKVTESQTSNIAHLPFFKNLNISFHNCGSLDPGMSTWWNLWSSLAISAAILGSLISRKKTGSLSLFTKHFTKPTNIQGFKLTYQIRDNAAYRERKKNTNSFEFEFEIAIKTTNENIETIDLSWFGDHTIHYSDWKYAYLQVTVFEHLWMTGLLHSQIFQVAEPRTLQLRDMVSPNHDGNRCMH